MNNVYTTWRQRILAPVFSILFVLALGFTANAQTYTTIANGNWNAAATWQGGTIPPNINPLPAAATVNIRHTVNFNIGGNIGNNGTIRIQPIAGTTARLNVPTGTNVENYSTGKFYILDASYVQFRFVPGNDGQPYSGNTPGAALQSGTFKNIGGYIECRNFYAEIAQDWSNESNGVRVYENGCIYTGQNFGLSGSGSIDTLLGINLSIGWHGSGNYTLSDGKVYYQGFRCQLAGTSGSFQLGSGTAWGDIDYIMLRNHVVPFNGGGLIEASSSVNVNDPATAGTVNLNLDAYHSATFNQNGRFIGTRTNTYPNSALNYFPANCPAGGAAPVINIDLSLTKTVNNTACYNSGDTRIFTLTVNNLSTTYTATDVTVNDLLPAGFTFVSSAGDGTYVSGTGVWTVGNIFAGQTKTRTITVTVTGTVDRTNTASFGTLNQTDPNLTNNGPSSVTVPACVAATYSLTGTVFNDVNGLNSGGNVDGTGTNVGGTLYVSLVSGGVAIATVPVNASGIYTFPTVTPGSYTVVLHNVAAGSNTPTAIPGYVNTGEDCCDNTGSDGTPNGIVAVTVAAANVTNANFGIEQPPTVNTTTAASQTNPGGTISATVPASTFGGTDPDGGTITAIRIIAFPTNATSITIDGVLYSTLGAIQTAYPNGIPTNAAGEPTVPILVDPNVDGAVTVSIPYKTIDNAGKESANTGTANQPFTAPVYSIQGNVLNDVGGLVADANVNGTGTNASGTLYVSLVNSSNAVVATVAVGAGGTYTFPTASPGSYTVVLHTTAAGSNVAAVPTGWATTGEDCCDNTGNDGTANGIVAVTVAASNITNANFGIEELPNSSIITAPAQLNPGGTNSSTVPSATFGGTDPSGGIITALRITAFPTNATSITINGILYSTLAAIQAAYPNGIPTNATGQPTVPILVDPADGNINVVIPYATIDNAGIEDPTPGSATIPFTNLPPVTNNIYNQPMNNSNGSTPVYSLTGSDIDGMVASYTITTIPPAAQGVLYLCNPACSPVTAGQIIAPADINKLQFDPAATFTGTVNFNYTALDNSGNTSNTSTVSIPVFNNPPTAQNILTASIINTANSSGIPPIGGSDPDGTVVSYTITSIPAPASGILYLCNPACVAVTPSQVIALADVAKLQFDPAPGFVGNAVYNYTSTDNNGNTSEAANYTIPVHGGVAANYPPVSNNIIAPSMPNNYGSTAIPGLETLDIDGTISTYTIATIPTAAMGVLYLCTPGCAPVIAGQVLTPAQMAQLQFDPAPTYTDNAVFTYSGTDNNSNVSNIATYTIPITNNPPIVDPVTTPPMSNTNGQTVIPAINGNDRDGTVNNYTITFIPAPASGILYLCNPVCVPVTLGQVISPVDADKLRFDPALGFTGNAVFNYTSSDNNSNVSAPAVYTIPVVATNYISGLPPIANNITATPMQSTNGSTAIPSLSSTDADGTIDSYKINTIPPASEGVLFLCNPACVAVTAGQVLTPAQIAQLLFDPAPGFNGNALFNYSTLDNSGNISNVATYSIPVLGLPPVANPVVNAALSSSAGPTSILPLTGSDPDGTIANYTITSIPPAAAGILYLCTPACTPVTVGQVLTPAQISQLQFDPAAGWNSPFTAFTFTTTDNSGNISNTANYTIPISNFGTLPVILSSFKGIPNKCEAVLQWKTAQEINSEKFVIEQSSNGLNFNPIADVKAANSASGKSYQAIISQPSGIMYYRLKLVDKDGNFTYSSIIKLRTSCNNPAYLSVYPNPVTTNITVSFFTEFRGQLNLVIANAVGQHLTSKKIMLTTSANSLNLDMTHYFPGIYTLYLMDDKGVKVGEAQKVIKK
jgi:hypothetical protein